jgi:hypothetical protein
MTIWYKLQATNGTFKSRSPSFSDGNIYGWNAYLGLGYTYPNFMDALMPLASLPVEIAGRNRIQRKNDKIN